MRIILNYIKLNDIHFKQGKSLFPKYFNYIMKYIINNDYLKNKILNFFKYDIFEL